MLVLWEIGTLMFIAFGLLALCPKLLAGLLLLGFGLIPFLTKSVYLPGHTIKGTLAQLHGTVWVLTGAAVCTFALA